jgi:hypothetical protein
MFFGIPGRPRRLAVAALVSSLALLLPVSASLGHHGAAQNQSSTISAAGETPPPVGLLDDGFHW